MIKAKIDVGHVEVNIKGKSENIAKELCAILDQLCERPETRLILIDAITNHMSHLQTS